VRTRLLCQDVPPPPDNVDVTFKPVGNPTTNRAHYEQSHSQGFCLDCHKYMDKIGFAFEHYGAFGRHRDLDNSYPIDATGTIVDANPTDRDVSIDGLTGTAGVQAYLAGNGDINTCMGRYWSYFAFGLSTWSQDQCTYDAINQEAQGGQYSLRAVLKAILHSPHFTSRTVDQ